jgi:hypothetical protein
MLPLAETDEQKVMELMRGGGKKRERGGQVINKHVRMSDPHKRGVQLFLLMLSHGNHVCTHYHFFIIQLYLNFLTRTI